MKANISHDERLIRIVMGVVVLALGFAFQNYWGLLGLIPLITGAFRWTPEYLPFRMSMAKKKNPDEIQSSGHERR